MAALVGDDRAFGRGLQPRSSAMSFRKPLIAAFLALAGALAAGAAHAGSDIHWSIGVNLPVYPNVSVGVSSAPPVYRPRYGYHAPVVVAPPPVVYVPQPVYRRPVPVYSAPVYVHQPSQWSRHDRWDRRDHRWDRRDDRSHRRHDRWDRHDDRRDGRGDRHDRRHDHDRRGR
jgi:hypothetical protein